MTSIITLDKSNYPIIVVSTSIKEFTESDVDEYLSIMTDLYIENAGKNIVMIYNFQLLKAIKSKGRIKIGMWLKEKSPIIKQAVAGVCYVQKNVFHKLILHGVFIINTPKWSHKIVKSIEEGVEWGKEQITQRNNKSL